VVLDEFWSEKIHGKQTRRALSKENLALFARKNAKIAPLESEKSSERFNKWQGYKKVLFFPSTLNRIGTALQMQLKNFKPASLSSTLNNPKS